MHGRVKFHALVFVAVFFAGNQNSIYINIQTKQRLSWKISRRAFFISGDTTPPPTDFRITTMLQMALSSIDVVLHDHLIVGDDFYSFAEQGWLGKEKQRFNDFLSPSKIQQHN